ncbi:MAG: hypothetical protein HXY26_09555 [Hydrogenophilaceae bacterium]|nr:hypothetical protein [Hydrogenophilaceae bacterium]
MSPLSARLRIALLPGRAALADGQGQAEAEDAAAGWPGALAALGRLLAERRPKGAASVVLSQHFVRFFLLPPPAAWLRQAEMQAWLAEQLRLALDGGEGWQLLWQPPMPGRPILVCAAEQALLDALRSLLSDAGIKLRHLEPWLAAAYNRREPVLRRATGWYALVEPGVAGLMRLERGRIAGLRQRQIGPEPVEELRGMVARESLLGRTSTGGELWLDSAGMRGPWQSLASSGMPVRELPTAATLHGAMLTP